jgi:hypothetical protein
MSEKSVHFIILCEDKQHEVFTRRTLRQLRFNFSYRDLRLVLPRGGSGEHHVRKNYPIEVKEHRVRATRRNGGLLVLMDADKETVEKHHQELAQELALALLPPRGNEERIALLIPKWNIETWIYFLLSGQDVKEDKSDYPKLRGRESDCQPAVEKLDEYLRIGLPDNCPPSLQRGAEELKTRLPQ